MPGSVLIRASVFEEIAASCHPEHSPRRIHYTRVQLTWMQSVADRQSNPAQGEWIADQNRHQNPSRSPHDLNPPKVDKYDQCARSAHPGALLRGGCHACATIQL